MPIVQQFTPPASNYALGRNSIFYIRDIVNGNRIPPVNDGSPPALGPWIPICVSDGSMDFTSDTIEISNNCNLGWKLTLPGIKSGTISLTGHLVSQAGQKSYYQDDLNYQPNILSYLGTIVQFAAFITDSNGYGAAWLSGYVVLNGIRTSISMSDAVSCELSMTLSGPLQAGMDPTVAKNQQVDTTKVPFIQIASQSLKWQ